MVKKAAGTETQPPKKHRSSVWMTFVFCTISILSLAFMAAIPIAYNRLLLHRQMTIPTPTVAGVYGDFLSGTLGPLLALVSIYFVVLALREQRATTDAERDGEEVQAFQEKFYQLIGMHRQNVAEMQLGRGENKKIGRAVFVSILDELQVAQSCVQKAAVDITEPMSQLQQLQIAYCAVFFGVGQNASAQMREAIWAIGIYLSSAELDQVEFCLHAHGRQTS